MPKLMELYDKRNAAVTAARAFLDAKRAVSETLSAEDDTTYRKMESDIAALSKEIERESRLSAFENDLKRPTSAPILGVPDTNGGSARLGGNADIDANGRPKSGIARDEYKSALLAALRSNFKRVNNILEEGSDSNGGYLVPVEYDTRLIDGLNEENIFRKLGTTIKTSGEHKINIASNKPAAAWIEEGSALQFSDATFGQIVLDAYKLHVAVKVTEELLYDEAFGLENYILDQFAKALANAEEDAFLNGDGIGKPTGLLSTNGGAQVGVTSNAANTITYDEVVSLVYSLKRPYRKNAAFIVNDQTLALLRRLKDATGAYLWQPAIQGGEPDRLLGYPVYTSAYMPTIAAGASVMLFGDFSYYNIGDRGQRSVSELRELFAGNGMVAFVAKERVDGKLVLPEAVQILKMK